MAASSLRIDVLTGRQVIVAPQRSLRPGSASVDPVLVDPKQGNPFLEGNEWQTPNEVLSLRAADSDADHPGWLLRVVPNQYPAVVSDSPQVSSASQLLKQQRITGVHEVVIESPLPHRRLTELTAAETARILQAWQRRVDAIEQLPSVASITVFRNEGFSAGASLPHVHSQILAQDTECPQMTARLRRNREHLEQTGKALFRDLLEAEIEQETRIVFQNSDYVVMCPYAGRVTWQVRIAPRFPCTLGDCSDDRLAVLGAALNAAAKAIHRVAGPLATNVVLIHPPPGERDLGWFLDLMPRPARMAGYELATDVDIVTVTPESAADLLRQEFQVTPPRRQDIVPSGYVWKGRSSFGETAV